MSLFINGPFNYVQLSGNTNNIQKNITIFMDVHLDINNQTRCDSFDSSDIAQYLYQLIKDTKIPLDFFLEIRHEFLNQSQTDKKDIYIFEAMEMFKSEFIIEKNKVKYAKSNQNVRLHYLDIRDHLQFSYVLDELNKNILPKLNSLKNDVLSDSNKINKLEQIKQHINIIKKYTNDIFEKYMNIYLDKSTIYKKKSQEYYLNKIIHKYKHLCVKKNIDEFHKKNIIEYNSKFNTLTSEIILYIILYKADVNNKSYLLKLYALYDNLYNNIFELYALITDIYFLRRFLDKDYIQNVITYCGRNHALNYIYFLVKYCNFSITKIYNTNGLTIDDITNKIKETDELNKIYNLFLFEGEKPKQCVERPNYNPELVW
jgi:hypothetical protein